MVLPVGGRKPGIPDRTDFELNTEVSSLQTFRAKGEPLADRVIMAIRDRFPDLDDTGATDATAALQAILDAAPYGSTVRLVGDYLLDNVTVDPTKFLTIDASGATLIAANAGTMISCTGSFGTIYGVSAIEQESGVVTGSQTVTMTKLTMDSSPDWAEGDIIKLFSDDVIPGGHVTSDTTKPRMGEYLTVHSVSGTTVLCKGQLQETEPYTTNVRAARLNPGSVTLLYPTFDVTDARLSGGVDGDMFRATAVMMPRVIGPRARRLCGMAFAFKSCYGYLVDMGQTDTGLNDATNGVISYSVHDSGCQHGMVRGGIMRGGRHAFTDGANNPAAGDTNPANYGATINTKIIGVTALDMTSACFDTHHDSLRQEFIDCTAVGVPEQPAFLLRGRKHRIINPKVYGASEVVYIYSQISGSWSQGESYGHELINATAENCERVFLVAPRTDSNHPNEGLRDSDNLTIHGGVFRNVARIGIAWNAEVRFRGTPEFFVGPFTQGALLESRNALVDGDIIIDASGVTDVNPSGTKRVLYINDASDESSDVRLTMRLTASSTYRAAATTPFAATQYAGKVILGVRFAEYWGVQNPFSSVSASLTDPEIDWDIDASGSVSDSYRHSGQLDVSNDGLTGDLSRLFWSRKPNLLLTCTINDSSTRTLAAFPKGKYRGQRLRVLAGSLNADLTLDNGTTPNRGNAGGTSKVLSSNNDQISYFWTGSIWRQETSV